VVGGFEGGERFNKHLTHLHARCCGHQDKAGVVAIGERAHAPHDLQRLWLHLACASKEARGRAGEGEGASCQAPSAHWLTQMAQAEEGLGELQGA